MNRKNGNGCRNTLLGLTNKIKNENKIDKKCVNK